MQAVIEILSAAEPQVRAHWRQRPPPSDRHALFAWEIARNRIAPGLVEALRALPIFGSRPQRVLDIGAGLRGFHDMELAGQLLDVVATSGTAVAASSLDRLQSLEALELEHRHLVWGLTAPHECELVPGVLIRPVDEIGQQARRHELQALPWDLRIDVGFCEIGARYTIAPAYVACPQGPPEPPVEQYPVRALSARIADLTTALVAIGPAPLTFEFGETRHQDPALDALLPFLGRSLGPRDLRPVRRFPSTAVNSTTLAYCAAFEALAPGNRRRVLGASKRLHRALRTFGAAEIAIDVVRSLEYLFRDQATHHGSNRSAVTGQVRALLPELGKGSRAQLDALYGLRNQAAHGEDLPPAALGVATAAVDLCARAIRAVVQG